MYLPSTNIFLDTEVFVAANYNCRSNKFETIVNYAKSRDIRLFITDIIDRETRNSISLAVENAYESLAKVRDGIRVLNNDDEFYKAVSRDQKDKYKEKLSGIFDSFLKRSLANKLDTSEICTGPIMDLYFQFKPPFNRALKKNEFPDAINVKYIADWTTAKKTNAIFVSKDKDIPELVRSMEAQDRIICYESIEKLISNIVASKEYEKELEEAIMEAKDTFENSLEQMVSDAAISIRSFDADVEEQRLISYNITSVNVLSAEKDYALCECEFEIEYELRVAYNDPGSFWWDSEEKEAYYTSRKHSIKSKIDYFYLEVELTRQDKNSEWDVDLVPSSLSKTVNLDLY